MTDFKNDLFDFEIAHLKWLSYEWSTKPTAFILLSDFKNAPKEVIKTELAPGINVSFMILNDKYCIGYPDTDDNLIPCETTTRVTLGNQCRECIDKDILSKCTYCTGDCVNSGALEYCKTTPHLVYLAAFTKDFIKVGTTSEKRAETRLLEQGANYARIIARTPSQGLAKQIEEYIKTTFSVLDKRNKRIKEESLGLGFQTSDFTSMLDEKITEIKKKSSKFSEFFIKDIQEFDFYSRYATLLMADGATRISFQRAEKSKELKVEGRLVCPKGDFLVLNNNGIISAVNLSSKVGNLLSNGATKSKQLNLL